MTEQEKKQRTSEYNRRYYNEKRKKQLQEKRLLEEKKMNGEQLTLFKDQLPDTVLPNETDAGDQEENAFKGVQLTMFDIEKELEDQNSKPLDLETHQADSNSYTISPSDSGILPNEKKKISILRDDTIQEQSTIVLKDNNSRNLELEKPILENSRSIENLNFKNQFQSSITFQDQDLVSSFVELVKERAKEALFPNIEHKKRTLWKCLEILVNFLMILGCLFVLTQTVRVIDQALFLPVLTCEIVAIFFSFSVSKTKGASKVFSLFIVTFAIILSNALMVKTIY